MLYCKRKAFTMIELVFVIVVIGILAAIAIPRFTATRDDAQIAKGRSDVAAIRAGIVNERQTRLLQGDATYATALEDTGEDLFANVMQYGLADSDTNGHWHKNSDGTYQFKALGTATVFTYTSGTGTFNCTAGSDYCNQLTR